MIKNLELEGLFFLLEQNNLNNSKLTDKNNNQILNLKDIIQNEEYCYEGMAKLVSIKDKKESLFDINLKTYMSTIDKLENEIYNKLAFVINNKTSTIKIDDNILNEIENTSCYIMTYI
ncbi:hypothetical protein [Clostridium sp.]|uniref:hypothetical protein n=1 Tax=Clostridium sp. TaxID=1506 RepID=UPI0026201F27|nr:hypothetical protein [Clostridium sp.]